MYIWSYTLGATFYCVHVTSLLEWDDTLLHHLSFYERPAPPEPYISTCMYVIYSTTKLLNVLNWNTNCTYFVFVRRSTKCWVRLHVPWRLFVKRGAWQKSVVTCDTVATSDLAEINDVFILGNRPPNRIWIRCFVHTRQALRLNLAPGVESDSAMMVNLFEFLQPLIAFLTIPWPSIYFSSSF
jgi:hypothetical protein